MKTPTKFYKPFQAEDIERYRSIGNCVCGHEPGVGKTAIAIGLIKGRTLIVVPKKALFQFAEEIVSFRPELCATVISGTPRQRKKGYEEEKGLLLLTYETLRGDIKQIVSLTTFNTIIFDEAHRLASTTTKTHKAVRNLLAYYKQQGHPRPVIYGATASLIMNSPMDVYGVYNILRPDLFRNYLYFVNEYMTKHPIFGYMVGPRKNKLPQLGQIIKPYYFRRTLAEVCPELPPHLDEKLSFQLSPAETKLYNDIRYTLLIELDPKSIDKIKHPSSLYNALTRLQKLSELTDHPALIGNSGIKSTKLEILKDKVDEVLKDNSRKAIIYSWFARRLLPYLLPDYKEYNPAVIVGQMTDKESEEARVRFKTDPACRVLILSRAGSEALSFEEASYLFRLDTPFSIGRDIQLSGRIRRQTTVEPTFEYTLVAKGTVDEHMLKILAKKKQINSSVFDWEDINELLT